MLKIGREREGLSKCPIAKFSDLERPEYTRTQEEQQRGF